MAFNFASITGAPVTGLTTPSYSTTKVVTDAVEERWVVSTVGGTQPGVQAHSPSVPFMLTANYPRSFRTLGFNPESGKVLQNVPKNVYRLKAVKGLTVLPGQPSQLADIEIVVRIPAGAEVNDAAGVAALLSLQNGLANAAAQAWYDRMVKGT